MTLNGLQNVRLSVAISIRNLSETTAKNRRIANEVKRLLEMGDFKGEDIQSNILLGEKRKLIDLELSLCSQKLWNERREIMDLINQNARIYVCGKVAKLPRQTEKLLVASTLNSKQRAALNSKMVRRFEIQ